PNTADSAPTWHSVPMGAPSLPIERLPLEPPRAVPRLRLSDFQRAQVRRAAREAVVHRRNHHARIHRLAPRLEPKVQVDGVIDRMAIRRVRRSQPLKIVEIDLDAVRLLLRGFAEVGQGGEALPVSGPGLIQSLPGPRRQPRVLTDHTFV